MSRTRTTIISSICFLSALLFAGLSLYPARAEESLPARPELVVPANGYIQFQNVLDLCVDPGANAEDDSDDTMFLLDGRYGKASARVIVYAMGPGEVTSVLPLPAAADPRRMTYAKGMLYLYDDETREISVMDAATGEVTSTLPVNCRDLTADGDTLYVSAGRSVKRYSLADPASPLPLNPLEDDSMSNVSGLAVYLSGAEQNLLYTDESLPRYGVFRYDIAKNVSYRLNASTFYSRPLDVTAGSSYGFFAASDGIYCMNLAGVSAGTIAGVHRVDFTASPGEGVILQPTALQYDASLGLLYVADNYSKSVQRFRVGAGGTLTYDGFQLSSFGSDTGRLTDPADAFVVGADRYVLDAGNDRIQVFSEDGDVQVLNLAALGVTGTARRITADSANNLYVATDSALYKLDAERNLAATVSAQTKITALTATNRSVYFADGKDVKRLDEAAAVTTVRTLTSAPTALCVDLKEQSLYVATSLGLYRYAADPKDNAMTFLSVNGIRDMDIDFKDTLFVLTDAPAIMRVTCREGAFEYEEQNVDLAVVSSAAMPIPVPSAPRALCIDTYTGETLLVYAESHLVARFGKEALNPATPTDIPVLEPPLNILDKRSNDGNTVPARIVSWPSTILYPIHESFRSHANYPENFCHTEYLVVENDTPVLILAEVENYYYVLYQNRAAFILNNSVNRLAELAPSYTDAAVLHDTVNVYKYPSTVKDASGEYAFKMDTLHKGDRITIRNKVADFKDDEGTLWYQIVYGTNVGYLARENATQNVEWNQSGPEKFGKVKADVAKGNVYLYDTMSTESTPITQVKDATQVRILKDYGNGWLYVQGEDVNGLLVNGFLESRSVTYEALTTSQIVGICLLCSVAVLLLAALILYKIFKSRAKAKTR